MVAATCDRTALLAAQEAAALLSSKATAQQLVLGTAGSGHCWHGWQQHCVSGINVYVFLFPVSFLVLVLV
jgi:hypothetical protein